MSARLDSIGAEQRRTNSAVASSGNEDEMRKLLILVCLLAALCIPVYAQQFENSIKGQITTAGSTCSTTATATNCTTLRLPLGAASASATVTAIEAFNGVTLLFEASADNITYVAIAGAPAATGTAVTSTTAAGVWRFSVAGFRYLRIRCSVRTTAGVAGVFLLGSTGHLQVGAVAGP
jgi:hypothetical protein